MDLIKDRLFRENVQIDLTRSVHTLIEDRDIGPLCEVIQEKVLSQLSRNDADLSLGDGLKLCFLLALNLSGNNVQSMNDDRSCGDLVIQNAGIHIEFKSIQLEHVVGVPSGRIYQPKLKEGRYTWDEGVSIAKEISSLSDAQLLTLKVNIPKTEIQTVNDVWDQAKNQTKDNQKCISNKLGTPVVSFCVLKVGLYRLKYMKM
jgi:hypothetical protein